MILFIINHKFKYETENLCRVFMNGEELKTESGFFDCDRYILTEATYGNDGEVRVTCRVKTDDYSDLGMLKFADLNAFENDGEYEIAITLYHMLVKMTGYEPKWGILTGVRPSKLMRRLIDDCGKQKAVMYFEDKLFVSPEKTELCRGITEKQRNIISSVTKDGFSLYISIPFCPSRCLYCSFVSHSIEKTYKLIPKYVDLLCEEIKLTAEYAKRLGLKLQSVYFGGGTPTSLEAEQLDRLMKTINAGFDLSQCLEYTVEAGRPDTITQQKLETIKANGAGRISINTQTTNDEVLKLIGRKHTAEDYFRTMRLAKSVGINSINTDIIAGLPGDTLGSFKKTVEDVLNEHPESVTVHTLAIKRSSALNRLKLPHSSEVGEMLDYAAARLAECGQHPYYMYRQSNMASNLENVGYCLDGHEGIYNVIMMEEVETVLSCGAGAVTKLKVFGEDKLERIFNFKFPYEYIDRYDEIVERKKNIVNFYDSNC